MIRIVIAEDQRMLLGTLGSLLNLEGDMEVVGKASNGEEALNLVHQLQPDICIMDIEMPGMGGLEAAQELKSIGCKVIILTTFARSGYFHRVLQAGVRGYLLKDSPSEELASSIRTVMADIQIYAPELMDDFYSEENPHTGRKINLEEQINTKEFVHPFASINSTLRSYVSMMLDKLDVTNKIEAITHFKKKSQLNKSGKIG